MEGKGGRMGQKGQGIAVDLRLAGKGGEVDGKRPAKEAGFCLKIPPLRYLVVKGRGKGIGRRQV
ncbi:MAG: hypothetical protein HZLCBSQH_000449 [Candidatus Fervidibacterota bacterium]